MENQPHGTGARDETHRFAVTKDDSQQTPAWMNSGVPQYSCQTARQHDQIWRPPRGHDALTETRSGDHMTAIQRHREWYSSHEQTAHAGVNDLLRPIGT